MHKAGEASLRHFIILNPGARDSRSGQLIPSIMQELDISGIDYDYAITQSLSHALYLSRKACRDGYDVVVAAGGDGTINRVLNGLFDARGRRISRARFAVIYTGTSPDFCKSFGIPLDLKRAVSCLKRGKTIEIRPGMIRCASGWLRQAHGSFDIPEEHAVSRFFACCANIGLGPYLARRAASGIRRLIGDVPGTFVSLLATLATFRQVDFMLSLDGVEKPVRSLASLSVGRTFYIASGIKVQNDLAFTDERMYCLRVSELGFTSVPGMLSQVYSGRRIRETRCLGFDYYKEIRIAGNRLHPVIEFDGDPGAYLPASITAAPDLVDLVSDYREDS